MQKHRHGLTRRESLKLGGASMAAALFTSSGGALAGSAQASNGKAPAEGARPRNIIFMVSDGMSAGTLTLAESFSRIARNPDQRTHWETLLRRSDVTHGWQETYSLNSIVTDSSAAASAWGSGSRIHNGAVNMLPDGTRLTPLADLVKASGRKVALVTTTRITHATPAGFAATQESRNQEDPIAPQYLDKVDILLGGGGKHFQADSRADGRDLLGEYREHGYTHWEDRKQLLDGKASERVLGLFGNGSHLPYVIDRHETAWMEERVPTLAEMTRAALASLEAADEGFLMQVEGGRVDHAAHGTDAASMMWEQLDFDDAIGVVLEFAERRGDTLVVITSDHGNANPGLNSHGSKTNRLFETLAKSNASFDRIISTIIKAAGEKPDAGTIADVVKTHCAVEVEADRADILAEAFASGNSTELNRQLFSFRGALSQVLGNHTGVQFTGRSHTADHTVCSALGPGQERFAGLAPNTDSFHHITELFGIDFENPSMTPEEAWRHAARAQAVPELVEM